MHLHNIMFFIIITSYCVILCYNEFEGSSGRVRGVSGTGVDSTSATYAPQTTVGALKLRYNILITLLYSTSYSII